MCPTFAVVMRILSSPALAARQVEQIPILMVLKAIPEKYLKENEFISLILGGIKHETVIVQLLGKFKCSKLYLQTMKLNFRDKII